MQQYLVICPAAFIMSGLTLFSGFGLGTVLLPLFAIFFPPELAVALTAIVHFLNNLFKLSLFGKNANKGIVIKFGLPAILSALAGAYLLKWLSQSGTSASLVLFGLTLRFVPVKIVISLLMLSFAYIEVHPKLRDLSFKKEFLPVGGILSGFFGGLSGHQGALRSAFLIRYGLSKEAFIGTGVVIACAIDLTRLAVYAENLSGDVLKTNSLLLLASSVSAFLGVWLGGRLLKKTTLLTVQLLVSIFLAVIALALGLGLI